MSPRLSLLVILCLALSPVAAAQEATPQMPVESDAPAQPTEGTGVRAGEDVVRSLMFGTGIMDAFFSTFESQMMPQMRASLESSPFYRSLTRRHREALAAYLDTAPALLRREIEVEVETIAARAGPRFAQLMSQDELTGVAAFMRSPEARPLFDTLSQHHASRQGKDDGARPQYSDEDVRIMAAFMQTPAGIAFYRNGDAFNVILREELDAATARMTPRLQQILFAGMCNAIENECTAEMRRQISPN